MITVIRRAFDVNRLTKELGQAEAKIASLEEQLASRPVANNFIEVAKEFDASEYFDLMADRLMEDLGPVIERDAMSLLKRAMSSLRSDQGKPILYTSVAQDYYAGTHVFRFGFSRAETQIAVASL